MLASCWDLVHSESGYRSASTFTHVESVSYVSSPFICSCVLRSALACSDNSDRVGELQGAKSSIRDAELSEVVSVGDVHILIGEWIPLGPQPRIDEHYTSRVTPSLFQAPTQ